jgi:hypothetical protein
MRLLKTTLLLGLAILSLTCTPAGRPSAFFRPAGFDTDSRIDSVARQMAYMQSKLGFSTYDFEFATPKDKKLIAKFRAELNGNLVPELSGIYHIPPTGGNQNNQGRISVNFSHPQYQTQTPQSPTWELIVSSSGVGQSWTFKSPFILTEVAARSTGGSSGGGILGDDDQEHKVWDLEIWPVEVNKSEQNFKYTLTVKLEKIEKGEDLQKIRKEDFK